MAKEVYSVKWRGEDIGSYEVTGMDMWYLDGHFKSNESVLSKEFIELSKTLDLKKVMSDHKLGTRIELSNENKLDGLNELNKNMTGGEKEFIHALVLGNFKDTLCVRMVFDKKAVKILLKDTK
jgi:hypothetical protein